jgi:primary-amine oxidase
MIAPSAMLGSVSRALVGVSLALYLLMSTAQAAAPHPLDPLTADELARIKTILQQSGQFSRDTDFSWICLDEPPKKIVTDFKGGKEYPRRAYVAAVDYERKKTFDVIIDLRAGKIATLTDLGGLQPGMTDRDDKLGREIIDGDPAVKAALVARGLRIPGKVSETVMVQFMPFGHDPSIETGSGRLMRALFASDQDAINLAGPFVDGVMAVVDVFAGRVVRLVDRPGVPSAKIPHDVFRPEVRGARVGPSGISAPRKVRADFKIDGSMLTWRQWQFRFGFNLREGLVLYQLAFDDGARRRSIAYRASVAEVLTAYGDGGEFWSWLEIFDEAMFGLGATSIDVRPGREVPANARTVSTTVPDASRPGFSNVSHNRIYVYERDAGSLMLYRQGEQGFAARATELVIGHIASVGNYLYGFNWVFRQDGSFGFEVELAGQILAKFVAAKTCCATSLRGGGAIVSGDEQYGTLVYPGLVGINHQHWFNVRIDFDIDGTDNAVMETSLAGEGSGHAHGAHGRLTVEQRVLGTAREARREMDHHAGRSWLISNPSSLRSTGRPAGYSVMAGENAATLFDPLREKDAVGFTFHHLWVTPYRDGELYAAGRHPNQAGSNYADSLFHYANDDPVQNRDIVLWYSLGNTHVPRPEDFPVMTNMKLSVSFRPNGFFERNPATGLGEVFGIGQEARPPSGRR